MKKLKLSSTLIVVNRSRLQNTNYEKMKMKILMLQRHSKSSFLPEKFVFPGGIIHSSDSDPAWNDLFNGITGLSCEEINRKYNLDKINFPIIKQNMHLKIHPHIAFRICAIRETFEESGLLLNISEKKIKESGKKLNFPLDSIDLLDEKKLKWREEVHKDPKLFIEMCRELKSVPNLWALHSWRNWMTPVFKNEKLNKTKFNTMFYLVLIDSKTTPQIFPDFKEITFAKWIEPKEFMAVEKNYCNLAPPQIYELNRLLDPFFYQRIQIPQDKIEEPVTLPCFRYHGKSQILVLPGDSLYEEWKDLHLTEMDEETFEEAQQAKGSLNRMYLQGEDFNITKALVRVSEKSEKN